MFHACYSDASVNHMFKDFLVFQQPAKGAVVLGTVPALIPLGPGASYTNTQSVSLPLNATTLPASYFVVVEADYAGIQPEADATNNFGSQLISVTYPPLPDLVITNVILPTNAIPGQIVPVVWTVGNIGQATVSGGWME